jgi:tyrosyl-tRNA synthetase
MSKNISPDLSIDDQVKILTQGLVEVIPEDGIKSKLILSQKEKRSLIIKYGADPSAPDIHLGHTVPIRKLRQFQLLGHQIIFLIGDFTGMIGDPSGKSKTRKTLSKDEVALNAETYKKQIFKILDPDKTVIRFNSEWCAPMHFEDVLKLTAKYTVARLLERDDFSKRFKEGSPISMIEFMYPLVQGYDSVYLKADIELGGTDQKFNLLVGRELMREYGVEPQSCIITPIIEGTDGVAKMSKSLNNYIGIDESPEEIYGKCMRIDDNLMFKYLELLTDIFPDTINNYRTEIKNGKNPKEIKELLAYEIVKTYQGLESAEKSREFFIRQAKREAPTDVESFKVPGNSGSLFQIIVDAKLLPSTSEARRMIKQGGVSVDDEKITDEKYQLTIDKEKILKVGKRKYIKLVP